MVTLVNPKRILGLNKGNPEIRSKNRKGQMRLPHMQATTLPDASFCAEPQKRKCLNDTSQATSSKWKLPSEEIEASSLNQSAETVIPERRFWRTAPGPKFLR